MRQNEPDWVQIGFFCDAGRRALWIRVAEDERGEATKIELCSGREGDDAYVCLTPDNPQWPDLMDVLLRAQPAPV